MTFQLIITPDFFPDSTYIDLVAMAKTVGDNIETDDLCRAHTDSRYTPDAPWTCNRQAEHDGPHVEAALVTAAIDDDGSMFVIPLAIWKD